MSDKIPEFYTGQRIQAMQTSSNESYGIDAVCGVVIVRRNQFDIVCFFENGKILSIDSSGLIHIDEATYQNWKKNGVDTSKTVAERKQIQNLQALNARYKEALEKIVKNEYDLMSITNTETKDFVLVIAEQALRSKNENK